MAAVTEYAHFVAHARPGHAPLCDEESARWLWRRLRAAFPLALAVVLMLDHLHMVARAADAREARRRLAAILGAMARRVGVGELWLPVAEPEPLCTRDKLWRAVRYVALNPCRPAKVGGASVRLASDPLVWPWSTHRDVVGAVVDPWVDAKRLASALAASPHDFVRRYHGYVSSDPHVHVHGTPLPEPAAPSALPVRHLADIQRAACAATRQPPAALRQRGVARQVFVALAYDQGWHQPSRLGDTCGAHRTSVRRLALSCPSQWLAAASLCLGDNRLLRSVPPEMLGSVAFRREQVLAEPEMHQLEANRAEQIHSAYARRDSNPRHPDPKSGALSS